MAGTPTALPHALVTIPVPESAGCSDEAPLRDGARRGGAVRVSPSWLGSADPLGRRSPEYDGDAKIGLLRDNDLVHFYELVT